MISPTAPRYTPGMGSSAPPPAPVPVHPLNGLGAVSVLTHGLAGKGELPTPKAGVTAPMTPTQVRAMQQFLNNHGFQVAQDGIMGPQTASAAKAFRANHKGGDAWNAINGTGVHPTAHDTAGVTPPSPSTAPRTPAAVTPPAGVDTSGALQQLIQAMLGTGGNVGSQYDPASFGKAAAAPDAAAAQALQRQVGANPAQEGQNQADISNWYGLDPKAKSYQLSVLGRLAQAKAGDAQATTNVQDNMGDLAKSLAGSIGGAANDGSSSVLAAGQNAAGTVGALGQAQSDYESNIDPLLRAEAAGAASREKGANSQVLMDLQDKLAAARGQATADRAQGVMGATDKNNTLAQQRFANQGNLLSTLAQLQASDPNAPTLANAKVQAQINEINAQATRARASATHLVNGGSTKPPLRSFASSSTDDRRKFTQDVAAAVAPGGQLPKDMTRSKAISIARRVAGIYWPNGGIPNGTGIISNIIAQLGL